MTRRRGRRCRKLLDDLKERRGYSYLKEEALDRTVWRAGFGRSFGPVLRQTTKCMNNKHNTKTPWSLEISKREAKWFGHILRRNCLLQRVIEGKIKGGVEVRERRGRRRWKLLDYLKERRRYSHLKYEALDRTMWRAGFGRSFGPVVRQINKWINEF